MKNRSKFYIMAIVLIAIIACGNKDIVNPSANCERELNAYSAAATSFSTTPSKKNCEVLINALDNFVKRCSSIPAIQRAEYEKSRKEIDCTQF